MRTAIDMDCLGLMCKFLLYGFRNKYTKDLQIVYSYNIIFCNINRER